MPCVDALKAVACLLIVFHHLAFYGPMSDIAYPLMPTVIDLFYQYGRMAVQAFFVIAGFLLATKFAPDGAAVVSRPLNAIYQRYLRLVIPYLVALVFAILCAALAREWVSSDSIPDAPALHNSCRISSSCRICWTRTPCPPASGMSPLISSYLP